jgi:MFS family permease
MGAKDLQGRPVAFPVLDARPSRAGAQREVPRTSDGVWAPGRRRLTAGLVLTVTLVAFESLAISTVMPVVADELGGLGLYGWVFSGFFLGSLLGIVVAGQLADQRGTRFPFVVGLVCFTIGLVVGASAQSMGMLVAGRVAQGFGAGVIPAVAYVSVGRVYPSELRPRVFAVFSSAWVIPGLVGPAAASTLADVASWRAVFGTLLPLVAIAAAMTLPALTDRPVATPAEAKPAAGPPPHAADRDDSARAGAELRDRHDASAPSAADRDDSASAGAEPRNGVGPAHLDRNDGRGPGGAERDRPLWALVLVAGTAMVLAGLGAPGSPVVGAALVVGGGLAAVRAFLRLVPPGTVRLAAGLPAAVAVRGILTLAFFGADAYVSLAVTDARGASTRLAGAALTACTLTWTAGSWIQQRVIADRGPRWLVRRGFLFVAAGVAGLLIVLTSVPPALAVVAWAVGGLGMGIAYGPLSVTALGLAEPGREGEATASLQLTDVLGVSMGTGLAGVFVALGEGRGWTVGSSLTVAFSVTLVVALAGVLAAGRLPRTLPD